MKKAEGTLIISNGQLIDGTGAAAVPDAALVIQDGVIAYAGPAQGAPDLPPAAQRIDARGGTIMPGLVEAHFHATYFNIAALEDLDIKYPVEYVSLLASVNTRLAVECGYTAARSGGCLFNVDVWLKKAIEADLIVGPRLASSGREICSAGGLMDWNPEFRKIGMEGLVFIINGQEDARKAVRALVKDGIEWVKTYPTGDAASPDINDHHTLCMTFEEMHAVVATAHNHKLKVTGHCRATEGIKKPCAPATTRSSTAPSWTTLFSMRSPSRRFSAESLALIDPAVLEPISVGQWLDGFDLAALAPRVRCPLWLLQADPAHGGMLTNPDAESLSSRLPAAAVKRIRFPGAGHSLHWSHPARLVEIIRAAGE